MLEETGVTYKCDLCNFSSNRKNELGLHISNNHAKFSEIEIEESCLENVAEDQESIAVATPAGDDEKDADDPVPGCDVDQKDADVPFHNESLLRVGGIHVDCVNERQAQSDGNHKAKTDVMIIGLQH